MGVIKYFFWGFFCVILTYCSSSEIKNYINTGKEPQIFPDYKNVVIPCNIAPLNFRFKDEQKEGVLDLKGKNSLLHVKSDNGRFMISPNKWNKLLKENRGRKIELIVFEKDKDSWKKNNSFPIFISSDSIDSHLVYRLIEPGYKTFFQMGIYQRNLQKFKQSPIYENKGTEKNCINCHSFCNQNPNEMLFHIRGKEGGTMVIKDDVIEKMNTKTDQTISNLVYPCWHPGGRYVAFSVNNTQQVFYMHNRNRIEVYDSKSDVVIYDTQKYEIFTSPFLSDKTKLETFPGFSSDGKILYFCSAVSNEVPAKSDSVKYSLCAISFDEEHQSFGTTVDTIFNADKMDKSAAFPRVSPNGKYLMFTAAAYGCFPIWHKEADLYLYDLKAHKYIDLSNVNSPDVDSYHSWSSNSKWFVFSSRRVDGLYTRPFIAHIDEKGIVGKAFMLPQENPDFYDAFMNSYNIPELVRDKVHVDSYNIAKKAKTKSIQVNYKSN